MKVIEKLKNVKTNVVAGVNGMLLAFAASPGVHANEGMGVMMDILNEIIPFIAVIGVPIACVGAFKLVMAFRNDQGDAVPAAARDLAIGIVLILFSVIWNGVSGSLAGLG